MADNARKAPATKEPKPKEQWQIEADQRTKDLTDKLEAGMNELFSSEKYTEYLKTMSKFHNYSSRNIMLIKQQMPHATKIASFKSWKENFKRDVKRGETSLRIFAPIGKKDPETVLMEKIDPDTKAPMRDKDGSVIMEEMTALSGRTPFGSVAPWSSLPSCSGLPGGVVLQGVGSSGVSLLPQIKKSPSISSSERFSCSLLDWG